ncbi:hypothetical protein C0J52_19017 [Blattella germanica]|nr:hypothetical protein C0J52_19017 [Blattella germanica]
MRTWRKITNSFLDTYYSQAFDNSMVSNPGRSITESGKATKRRETPRMKTQLALGVMKNVMTPPPKRGVDPMQ